MKKKLIIGIILISFVLAGCSKTGTFAVGFKGGTYESIVKTLNDLPWISFDIINSQGSGEIISTVNEGRADFGMVQLDILSNSLNTNSAGSQDVKIMMPLYVEEVHLITDIKIKSIDDLNGKIVSVGAPKSGSAGTVSIILNQLGLSKSLKEILYMEPADALENLQSGKIDATFIISGSPVELLAALPKEFGTKFRILPFNNERFEKISKEQYYYQKAIIQQKDYPWLDGDVKTISVISSFIVNKNVPDAKVEKVIKAIFSNQRELEKKHPKWKELDEDEIAWYLKDLADDFHPAAKRTLEISVSM